MENQNFENQTQQRQIVQVVGSPKNMGVAIILTILFGPLGMLYSTITGGIVMFVVTGLAFVFTMGLGLIVTWPICIIWSAVAASNHNKSLGR